MRPALTLGAELGVVNAVLVGVHLAAGEAAVVVGRLDTGGPDRSGLV